ncbi:MAG: polyprenyl synthetase family protein [Chloroflexi bacterium]|nr:polyprenyl synthetase family protein [Chloroflexota bacterium]
MTTLAFSTQVQDLMPEVEARMRGQTDGYHPSLKKALDQLLDSGGKRVRPTVVLLVSSMLGVDKEDSLNLAAAVELLHTATLVHDDLIDGSTLRRGSPTLNSTWNAPATILAGDFLFSQAASLGARVDSTEVMRMFAGTLSTIVNGEIAQIFERNSVTHREDYNQRIYAKTATMFEMAARAPAYLVGVEDQYSEALRVYGYSVGMAFQIVDDVLDFSSDTKTLGKPVASDLRIGLLTLPAICYLESHPDDARLKQFQSGYQLDPPIMEDLVQDIRKSGAVEQARAEADQLVQGAVNSLDQFPLSPEREALADLANYVVERLH